MSTALWSRFVGAMLGLFALLVGVQVEGKPRGEGAKAEEIRLDDLPTYGSDSLPLAILRAISSDPVKPTLCAVLRHCADLTLVAKAVDLNGDGAKEWIVTHTGYTGTGAELDFIFSLDRDRRWRMIGRIDGLTLTTVGPTKTGRHLDLNGAIAGVCVRGRGKAVWNGRRYVRREYGVKSNRC